MLKDLYSYYQKSVRERKRLSPELPITETHPWYGIDEFPDQVAFEKMRELVVSTLLRPSDNISVTGFKEIRWLDDDILEFVLFIRQVFPGARFVINTRDLAEVVKSRWWKTDREAISKLQRVEKRFMEVSDELGDNAFWVHYNDYVKNPKALKELFLWLGYEFDEKRVLSVLSRRHSY